MKTIMWLRKSLRVHDNPTLLACADKASTVVPVYVLDKWHSNPRNVGDVRFEFIMESLRDLDASLKKLGVENGIAFVQGEPEDVLPKIWKAIEASAIGFDDSEEQEKHSQKVDEKVLKLSGEDGIEFVGEHSHWLISPNIYDRHLKGNNPPLTMNNFMKLFEKCGNVSKPKDAPSSIPCDKAEGQDVYEKIKRALGAKSLAIPSRDDQDFYNTMKRKRMDLKFPGGETEGLNRLKKVIEQNANWVAKFEKPKTRPNALEPETTVMSPYINAGCVSSRRFYHAILDALSNASVQHTTPPESLLGQLHFHEMWYVVAHFTEENIGKMEECPFARKIDWDWDKDAKERLRRWENSETGYPFVDAIMTQLREEGWIHHLARHMAACFLTRGDLFVSWEHGAEVFDRYLIDADWSANNCNWMWLSCTAFFYQYFRCYSPVAFGKKTDKSGEYIRKYLPVLKNFPDKYIYEPWKAPESVQQDAGCIIGKDYPEPIVDHKSASKANMDRIAKAYERHKEQEKKRKSPSSSSQKRGSKKKKT